LQPLELLEKLKTKKLNLMLLARLSGYERLQFAVELLIFARFETHFIPDVIILIKHMLPHLPPKDRLWILLEVDTLIDDGNVCNGKNSSNYLDAVVLLSLNDEERFSLAKYLAQKLSPRQVLVSESALWAISRVYPLIDENQRAEILSSVISFLKTQTLPEKDVLLFIEKMFETLHVSEQVGLLFALVDSLLEDVNDEKYVVLILQSLCDHQKRLSASEKSRLLAGISSLMAHSHRKVVGHVIKIYTQILDAEPIDDVYLHLQTLMQHENQLEHIETICEVLQRHVQTLDCPKQKQSIHDFLQRWQNGVSFVSPVKFFP